MLPAILVPVIVIPVGMSAMMRMPRTRLGAGLRMPRTGLRARLRMPRTGLRAGLRMPRAGLRAGLRMPRAGLRARLRMPRAGLRTGAVVISMPSGARLWAGAIMIAGAARTAKLQTIH